MVKNRELTLKCKLKCYVNPWKTHWALALVKGIREPREVKEKILMTSGGNRTHDQYKKYKKYKYKNNTKIKYKLNYSRAMMFFFVYIAL